MTTAQATAMTTAQVLREARAMIPTDVQDRDDMGWAAVRALARTDVGKKEFYQGVHYLRQAYAPRLTWDELFDAAIELAERETQQQGETTMYYPENWPRCPSCGDYALDGHITCGRVECAEGDCRQSAEPSTREETET